MREQYHFNRNMENSFEQESEYELLPEFETSFSSASNPRNTSDYIKWIQTSLNQVLGMQMPISGIMSNYTRNIIRSFQRRNGRLTIDGVVGPNTERALILAGAAPPQPATNPVTIPVPPPGNTGVTMPPLIIQPRICSTLPLTRTIGGFALGSRQLSVSQGTQIANIARIIFDSLDPVLACNQPVTIIDIVGHTDNVGSSSANMTIGKRRADQVAAILSGIISVPLMAGRKPVPTINSTSRGPNNPIANNNSSSGRSLNRRVEITLR